MEEGPTYDVRSYQRPKSEKWPFILFGVVLLLIFVIVFIFVVKDSNKISEDELSTGTIVELEESNDVKFKIGDTEHRISVNLIGLDSADVTLQSDPLRFTLEINEIRRFDLDGDGYYDLRIKLINIKDGKAFISIRKIEQEVCREDWGCTLWSNCSNGTQTRICNDLSNCGTIEDKPEMGRECLEIVIVDEDNESLYSEDLENYISQVKAIDCSDYVAPNCGIAYPDEVSTYEIITEEYYGTSTLSIPVYDEDCAMVCFGKAFRNNCQEASVTFQDSSETKQTLEILGLNNEGECRVNMSFQEIGYSDMEYYNFEDTYMVCPIPIDHDSLAETSCPLGSCLEENMPGQTTVGVLTSIGLLLVFGVAEDYGCEGTTIGVFTDIWGSCDYDGSCDSGEDCDDCPADCGTCTPLTCGDCVAEDYVWCRFIDGYKEDFCNTDSFDCADPFGDTISLIEDCTGNGGGTEGESCSEDWQCGTGSFCVGDVCVEEAPMTNCGSGLCEGEETCSSCPSDCGVCTPQNCVDCVELGYDWCGLYNGTNFCDVSSECLYLPGEAISDVEYCL